MLIEILSPNGDFEKVDAHEYVKDAAKQYVKDAAEFGQEVSFEEATEILIEGASYTSGSLATFAQHETARRGWYGGAKDHNTGGYVFMSQRCFVGSRIQRTIYAGSLHDAVKALKHLRG